MTTDNKPMEVSKELFEAMAQMRCTMHLSGHELGALAFVLDAAVESGVKTLAMQMTPEQRETTEQLHRTITAMKASVDQAITYLGIAASAALAANQDAEQNAPSTDRPQ